MKPPVEAYLARLRRRAALLHGTRSLVAGLGAAALAFALAALLVGPLSGLALAVGGWAAVGAAAVAVGAWSWRAFAPLRGSGAARLLAIVDGKLPSAARTAYELGRRPAGDASDAMIRAHQEQVRATLERVPPSTVVRWRWLRHRTVALGIGGLSIAAMLLVTERGGAGAYAMIHPGERDEAGQRVAVAFGDVEVHLVYPSYLDRDSTTVVDPSLIEVPRGTSIELRARARLDAAGATLGVGERQVPMELDDEGRWFARFVARDDAALTLGLATLDGEQVRDANERAVRAIEDQAPRVTLMDPVEDVVLDRPTEVAISWDVSDDVAVADVELVMRTPDGEVTRRRVGSYDDGQRPTQATGTHPIDPALLGLRPGDGVTVWVEARDGDVVSGPNLGRSAEVTITLASEATRRQQALAGLEALLDRGIHVLADRLERPVPEADTEAKTRFEALREPTDGFVAALRAHADELRRRPEGGGSDLGIYTSMASRVRRLLHEERLAHGQRVAPVARRTDVDGRAVEELEDDVLTLDDLLGRARVEDAAEIARELESIRQEIRSLLSELMRTDSPEARQRLLAAIGRAQARLRELMQRLGEMGTNVPQEFMNQGEMPTGQSADALEQLREAVQRGDLERADQLVGELTRQIDQIARALGQTEEGFVESRFGPRDRAMANAMDALAGLEAEQQQLSRRGTERRSRAARRALESIGGRDNRVGQRLARDTQRVREALEEIERDDLAGFEQDGYDRARQRLVDTEDALSAGDLGEARRMAEAAAQDVSSLSRDLDLSALMFPGHEGETSRSAQHARAADGRLRDLRRQLDESLPDVASHLEPQDRQQMQSDLERQREARGATERLGETFAEGPDGAPLHPDAPRELSEAADAMQQANRSLERGDPLESARLQEEAARRLTDLRERLENQQRQQSGGGGEGGSATPDFRRPVRIPDADQFEGPMEQRRRILDAMRESAPDGYEEAVRRYYEGLLR